MKKENSNPDHLNSEKKPSGLPKWVTISWLVVFPLAFLLTLRFIYEQTYLTWVNGQQMVGFTLAHQGIGFLILGMLSLGLTHLWLLTVVVLIAASKLGRPLRRLECTIMALTVLTVLLNYVPYLWWQRLVVRIPGSRLTQQDIFLEAAGEGGLGAVKSSLPSILDSNTLSKAFSAACVEGRIETMQFLLGKGADVNGVGDELGETPLMAAGQMGHADAVKMLLAHGADPNVKDKQGNTALSLALKYHHPEIAAMLQQGGATANIFDAASAGDVAAVRALLAKDPQVLKAKDATGYSPLYRAAEAGHTNTVSLLLAMGDNPNDFTGNNGWGYSPLLIAAQNGESDAVDLLLDHGADPNSRSRDGETALCLASRNGNFRIVQLLVAHGADVNVRGGSLLAAPLDEAAYSGNKEIADFLIAHNANLGVRDQYGFTPLHMAAYHGHSEVVDSLIAAGADINTKDNDGKTPLQEAKSRGQSGTAKILSQHGAKP